MGYEWDTAKNVANQIKHGISFEEARLIFEGDVLTGVDNVVTMARPAIPVSATSRE